MWARDAKFGDDLVQAYGIVWMEDLFEQGDEDSRYTTQVDAFLGAQHEWMSHHLPTKAIILQTDESGTPKLPPKAIPVLGKPGKGVTVGHYIDERDMRRVDGGYAVTHRRPGAL
jgi:ParB family transcriptional regulator, chromosome partitioning protein